MNERFYKDLVEASWRRPLNTEEKTALASFLALHPERKTEWGDDLTLTELLHQIPEAQVSSNFTARTLQALEAELRRAERPLAEAPWWRKWIQRLATRYAVATLLVLSSILGTFEYRLYHQKQVTQEMVSTLGRAAAVLPAPELLQDFDSIQLLGSGATSSDEDLLAVLDK